MNSSPIDVQGLTRDAVSALQSGDALRARSLFERAVKSPEADTSVWLGLAFACARVGDRKATLDAVDRALKLDPRNLRALVFKGDHLDHVGEPRKALQAYQAALRLAAQAANLPPDLVEGTRRAQAFCQRLDAEYSAYLFEQLAAAGFEPGRSAPRFWRSLDIVAGKAKVYHQEPRRYYFPDLPQIQFYEREDFPWVEALEAQTDNIRAELEVMLAGRERFSPYLAGDGSHLNQPGSELVNNDDWGAFYFWHYGELVAENVESCPSVLKGIEGAPLPHIQGQAPIALFSRLKPHTRIPPHNGLLNTRLICHLPIIVPENCGALRVGSEQRAWQEGRALIFDDSIEHEAWNDSGEQRVVLLFEVWRPELTEEERALVSATLEAVRNYFDG